ncbi:MAG TPA: hypothetical protein VFV00_15860 [Acidimicrobiales bacterium]|nr:hypothetical protein [Acidimicrobiales bacterium]
MGYFEGFGAFRTRNQRLLGESTVAGCSPARSYGVTTGEAGSSRGWGAPAGASAPHTPRCASTPVRSFGLPAWEL